MKKFIHDLLTDSANQYSSRIISGWIAFFVLMVVVVIGCITGKDISNTITPLFVYIGGCFGLSVFGELSKNKSETIEKIVEEEK